MPTEVKFEAPAAIVSYESGDLDSLADGDNVLCDKIDNVADGENEMFISLELNLGATGSRDTDARVEIFILYSLDDSTFDMPDATTPDPRPEALLHVFSLDGGVTTARRRVAVNIPIAPFDFKLVVMNECGGAFAATGNTLKYRLHSAESQ